MPKLAESDAEIIACFRVMSQLRTHLKKDDFLPTIRAMEREGYKLAYIEDSGAVVAVAGYRIYSNLFMGKHLYVDDLVTDERERSNGHGERMILWLKTLAIKQQCNYLHLDSGTHRHMAHRFYLNQGFDIASYHFSQQLNI